MVSGSKAALALQIAASNEQAVRALCELQGTIISTLVAAGHDATPARDLLNKLESLRDAITDQLEVLQTGLTRQAVAH